jgi:hypothetical protein
VDQRKKKGCVEKDRDATQNRGAGREKKRGDVPDAIGRLNSYS